MSAKFITKPVHLGKGVLLALHFLSSYLHQKLILQPQWVLVFLSLDGISLANAQEYKQGRSRNPLSQTQVERPGFYEARKETLQ